MSEHHTNHHGEQPPPPLAGGVGLGFALGVGLGEGDGEGDGDGDGDGEGDGDGDGEGEGDGAGAAIANVTGMMRVPKSIPGVTDSMRTSFITAFGSEGNIPEPLEVTLMGHMTVFTPAPPLTRTTRALLVPSTPTPLGGRTS